MNGLWEVHCVNQRDSSKFYSRRPTECLCKTCDLVSFRVSKEESIMLAGGRQVRTVLIYCKICDLVSVQVPKEESNVHEERGGR